MQRILRKTGLYGTAVLLAIVGWVLSWLLRTQFDAPNYSNGIIIANMAAFYLLGLGPGLLCLVLSLAGFVYFFLPPALTFRITSLSDVTRTGTLAVTIVFTSSLVVLLRNARMRAERLSDANRRTAEQLRETNEELRATAQELQDAQRQLHEALRYETNIASSLQKAFLPEMPERIGALHIAAVYEAGAEEAEVGGDFYDAFPMPDGNFGLLIGDASGKGLMAARQAIAAKYELRFCAMECSDSPQECIRRLNDTLSKDEHFSGFVTLFFGLLNPETHSLTYVLAGHPPPLLLKATGEIRELELSGRMVGILESALYQEQTIRLETGDRLLLYTDGLSEARTNGDLLGVEGVKLLIRSEYQDSTPEMLREILERGREHAGGKFRDDVAMMLVCVP